MPLQLGRDLVQRLLNLGAVVDAASPDAEALQIGRAKSIGVNIKLPFEQFPNRFIQGDSKHMPFHFFFTRKLMFVKEGDAFAFFPGGFGTHDEALEVLTLTQTG